MCGFYKILFLLICTGVVMRRRAEAVPKSDEALKDKIKLSNIATIADGKLERTKRGFLDYLLYGLYEYFDYGEESDSEEDEKYLICRNCTILINQSNNERIPSTGPSTVPANMTAGVVPNGNNATNGADVSMSSDSSGNGNKTSGEPAMNSEMR
ncbi:uncharacterized protein LOC105231063 isoform X2 [Bactrocera dorsalis]|uniref:Uncharacterized protein LOC105231063 isoform X2 n=1 Tax=Bactrocera dorsalis TaxID=27457 RepID=A0A034WXP8_BACDO|nr:uncharacterized protein LOC105231063 isoform X2 [Bactrocera dorsalis]XP_049303173.1 uncharacterized protein LOC105231063 isoform X2 [Bactrocera dorsalis]